MSDEEEPTLIEKADAEMPELMAEARAALGKCEECGYPEGSFACRIRHIHLNAGAARSNVGMKEQWERRKTPND